MRLTQIEIHLESFPIQLHPILRGAKVFDSSSSPEARVIFIDSGYFLKSAPLGRLKREADLTNYFNKKGLSANVVAYISGECDWLLTEKVSGDDCIAEKYMSHPEKLCDTLAEQLFLLHNTDFDDCPVPNHTEQYLLRATENYRNRCYDANLFPDNWGYKSAEEAWAAIEKYGAMLKTDTLLHGDYCLPNIILDDWKFSGFIDLDSGGVGDRHVDLFWGAWTLYFNLKTDKYCARFFDAYGREQIDEDMLRLVAAAEVFG